MTGDDMTRDRVRQPNQTNKFTLQRLHTDHQCSENTDGFQHSHPQTLHEIGSKQHCRLSWKRDTHSVWTCFVNILEHSECSSRRPGALYVNNILYIDIYILYIITAKSCVRLQKI